MGNRKLRGWDYNVKLDPGSMGKKIQIYEKFRVIEKPLIRHLRVIIAVKTHHDHGSSHKENISMQWLTYSSEV